MKNGTKIFAALFFLFVAFGNGCILSAATVTVFAASSLTDSLKDIAATYEKQTGDKIIFNFAGSGTLARQIEAGAPADIFFSADEAKMDSLEKKGLIVTGSRRNRLSNLLVAVVATDGTFTPKSAKELASPHIKRLALGDTKTVPAGTYALQYLAKMGLWPELQKKVIPCENVRAVLAAVESGNVEAGIVYKSDAAISQKVKVAYEVSAKEEPRICYPLALIKDSKQPAAAQKFMEHLAGPEAGVVFVCRGFILLPLPDKP